MTKEELYAFIEKSMGGLQRWELDEISKQITEWDLGEWVRYSEHKYILKELQLRVKALEDDYNVAYNRGYSSGKQAGPDYNMRND